MPLDGEAEQLYPHSWRILSLVELGDSITARIRRPHLRPSPTFGYSSVCAAWGFARSSFYAMKSRQQDTAERPPAKRRGPKPSISDEALLVAIEADLEASPWEGEGHRKVSMAEQKGTTSAV